MMNWNYSYYKNFSKNLVVTVKNEEAILVLLHRPGNTATSEVNLVALIVLESVNFSQKIRLVTYE